MVVATVLCSTRLTTCHEIVLRQLMAGATSGRGAHALHHIVVGFLRGFGMAALCIERVELFALNALHYMRRDEPPTVGDGCAQVSNLKRCSIDLTLSDGNRNNRQSVP